MGEPGERFGASATGRSGARVPPPDRTPLGIRCRGLTSDTPARNATDDDRAGRGSHPVDPRTDDTGRPILHGPFAAPGRRRGAGPLFRWPDRCDQGDVRPPSPRQRPRPSPVQRDRPCKVPAIRRRNPREDRRVLHPRVGSRRRDARRYAGYNHPLEAAECCTFAPSVADAYLSRGIGSTLMPLVVEAAHRLGRRKIVLWGGVRGDNPRARHFYRKFGF